MELVHEHCRVECHRTWIPIRRSAIHLFRHIDIILCRAIYCSVLRIFCVNRNWTTGMCKLLLYENLRQLTLLVVLRLAEHTYSCSFCYWFNNCICIAIQQCIVNILHAICNMPICRIVTALFSAMQVLCCCVMMWNQIPLLIYDSINILYIMRWHLPHMVN